MDPRPPGHSFLRRLALLAIAFACAFPAPASAVEVPPAANFFFQTNGPASAMGNGDWYTSTAPGGGAGYHYLEITVPCGWPSSEPVHLDLFSPEMNRDAGALGGNEEPLGNYDSTQFELYGPGVTQGPAENQPGPGTGISGSQVTYRPPDVGTPEEWTRYFTLPAPVACGNYLLRAEVLPAGADPLNAGAEGNDQNGWRLRVGRDDDAVPTNTPPANTDDYDGVQGTNDELSIGFVQTTFQHNQSGTHCQTMYESVPPGMASIRLHNFDFDGASTANRVRYYAPGETVDPNALSGGTVGTLSGSTVWNDSATTTRVGDLINNPTPGVWAIVSCINGINQFIQEAQAGATSSYTLPTTPSMNVTKTDGRTETYRGEELTYTVDVSNTASGEFAGAATNVSVIDTLPTNTTFVSCQITGAQERHVLGVRWHRDGCVERRPGRRLLVPGRVRRDCELERVRHGREHGEGVVDELGRRGHARAHRKRLGHGADRDRRSRLGRPGRRRGPGRRRAGPQRRDRRAPRPDRQQPP